MNIIAAKDARYVIGLDQAKGIVIARLFGFWTMDDVADYLPAIERAVGQSRALHGRALALFDLTQSQTMAASLYDDYQSKGGSPFIQTGDQVAIVLVSSLLKLQAKRMRSGSGDTSFFESRDAAERWLTTRMSAAA